MNTQTDTPMTDAMWSDTNLDAGATMRLCQRLERERAALIAALEACQVELVTLAPRLSGSFRTNIQAAADLARATLAQVRQ